MGGHVNRALLESYYQNPGDTYEDSMTEGAMEVIAQQVDDNWDDYDAHKKAAEIDHPDGSVTGRKIRNGTITADKFVPGALTNDTQNGLRITQLESDRVKKSGDTMTGPLDVRSDGIPTVIVRRENREDWIALASPFGAPYSSKIVIKSEGIGQDPTEYEMVRFNSSLGNVGKQISFLTSNVERVRVEDSITTILNGLWVTGQIYRGTGSPEGSVSAPVGSIYHRTDGGAGTTLYVKESGTGNTGWKAVQTA